MKDFLYSCKEKDYFPSKVFMTWGIGKLNGKEPWPLFAWVFKWKSKGKKRGYFSLEAKVDAFNFFLSLFHQKMVLSPSLS